jgi:hypothetical protein
MDVVVGWWGGGVVVWWCVVVWWLSTISRRTATSLNKSLRVEGRSVLVLLLGEVSTCGTGNSGQASPLSISFGGGRHRPQLKSLEQKPPTQPVLVSIPVKV